MTRRATSSVRFLRKYHGHCDNFRSVVWLLRITTLVSPSKALPSSSSLESTERRRFQLLPRQWPQQCATFSSKRSPALAMLTLFLIFSYSPLTVSCDIFCLCADSPELWPRLGYRKGHGAEGMSCRACFELKTNWKLGRAWAEKVTSDLDRREQMHFTICVWFDRSYLLT